MKTRGTGSVGSGHRGTGTERLIYGAGGHSRAAKRRPVIGRLPPHFEDALRAYNAEPTYNYYLLARPTKTM